MFRQHLPDHKDDETGPPNGHSQEGKTISWLYEKEYCT